MPEPDERQVIEKRTLVAEVLINDESGPLGKEKAEEREIEILRMAREDLGLHGACLGIEVKSEKGKTIGRVYHYGEKGELPFDFETRHFEYILG